MARQIADVLKYEGKQFLDARTVIKNISDFADGSIVNAELYYPNGFVAFCEEDKSYYQYFEDLTGDDVSETTGKWRRIGGLIDHQKKLGTNGLPDYAGTKISSDPDVYKIDETAIHIFDSESLNYNVGPDDAPVYEEVKIHTTFHLSDLAKTSDLLENKWTLNENGVAGDLVTGYKKGVLAISLKDKAWYPTGAGVEISPTGVKVDGVTYAYNNITVDMIKEWADSHKITPMNLAATELFTQDQDNQIMVHYTNKTFDCLGNLTKTRTLTTLPWNVVTDEIFKMAADRGIIVTEDYDRDYAYDNTEAAQIITSTGNIYNLVNKVNKKEIKTGWTYDVNGGWTKIFPADIEMSEESENAVANSAVTRAIAKAGHTAKLIYESDDKVLTLELNDKNGHTLSKVAVGLGSVSVDQPKVNAELEDDLFDITEGMQTVKLSIAVNKTTNDIQTVVVKNAANDTVIEDFTSEVTGESQNFVLEKDFDQTIEMKVEVTDIKGLIAITDTLTANFVDPCLYNGNGVDFVKALNLKGEDVFKFNFNETPSVGEAVLSAKPVIKIPSSMIAKHGDIVAILGGRVKDYLYTDYTESFDITVDDDNGYHIYTL